MTVQNLWPLAFLVLIPVIVLLYILKQKAKNQEFSSNLLWQEIYKNLEAKTPFEKLKKNILMYLQILLMLLLILALMAPVWKRGGVVKENVVLVMDTSASMLYQYGDSGTRLDYSIREAEKVIDGISEDAIVTLISCDSEAAIVYQGSDKITVKSRLKKLSAKEEAGNLELAVSLVNSVIAEMDNVQVICYTDTDFESQEMLRTNEDASLTLVNAYSRGENCSVDYVSYAAEDDGTTVLSKVTNYGTKDSTQDLSLYVNNQIVSVLPVTIPAGESDTLYFDKMDIAADGSAVVRVELSEKDALPEDNVQKTTVVSNQEKRVLLLSEGNVFLEKALGLNEGVAVYKSDSLSVLEQEQDVYDLYVFDGLAPEDGENPEWLSYIPGDAAVLFLNQAEDIGGLGGIRKNAQEKNAVLSFLETEVTEYISDYSFGMTETYTYTLPEWAMPLIKTAKGDICGYYGQNTADSGNRMVAVLGFDIHNSDLALQTEFPIFMAQLTNVMMGNQAESAEVSNFPTGTESDVVPAEEGIVAGEGKQVKTGGRSLRNLVLLLVILLLVAEWFIYIRQVHTSKKRQFLVLRILVLLAVILAISGLSVTVRQKKAQTIFLVDVSDSMSGNISEMEEYLKTTISKMPEKNSSAIILFGKDTAVDEFMTERKIFSEFTASPVTTATNIEKAVQTACLMFDEGVSKHLVLITDGSENEGSMSLSASSVKNNDVELSVIEMEDSIGAGKEVYIENLSVPSVIHVGDRYNVTVTVVSNVETNARLSLYAGRNLKGQQDIHLTIGTNQFVFEDTGEQETIAQYKAVIEPDEDTVAVNNTYATFAQVEAKPRLLLVEGKEGEAAEFEKVLQAANMEYDCVTPSGVPTTVAQLNIYKAVITLDVHYDDLRKGFAAALESYVKDYAGGYICIGGENSYALGNYRGKELEDILPVSMDLQGEKEIPKMAMAMAIDQSGSMLSPAADDTSVTCLTLAKQAALAGSQELRDTDEIGVLAFDDTYHWIVPIETASDRDKIEEAIETIGEGGGTSIYPAFEEAYNQILKSDAKIKHIILLTDGQDGFNQYEDLFEKVNEAGITVSTVAVGYDADQKTLAWIAEECGGRYYYTDMNNAVPRIFAQEVYLATNTYLINGEFYPAITSNNEILTGIFDEGMPAILGYIATTPKQTADVLLTSEQGDPVLCTWQYGLGRTAAWTSDGTNEWTAQYGTWENYPQLWSNIINYVIADTSLGEDSLEIKKSGNGAVITYDTKEYDKETKVTAVVTDEDGNSKEVTLDAVKPGSFQANLDVEQVGVYSVNIRKYSGEEIVNSYNTAYANQYSIEYQFADSSTDLTSYAAQSGGEMISMEDNIWKTRTGTVKSRTSLTIPLLILAVLLWLLDIICRRLSIDLAAIFGKAGRRFLAVLEPVMTLPKKFIGRKRRADAAESPGKSEESLSGAAVFENPENGEQNQKEAQEKHSEKKAGNKRKEEKKKQKKVSPPANDMLDMDQLLQKKKDRSGNG